MPHDLGAIPIQYFALTFPERVEAMILTNTGLIHSFAHIINSNPEAQEYARYSIPYFTYEPDQPKNISTLVENFRDPTYQASIASYLEESPLIGMMNYYKNFYPAPPYGQNVTLGPVQKVPTLLVWGEEEPDFTLKFWGGLEGWFKKGVRHVTVPRSGHWVHRDAWQTLSKEITNFLDNLRRK